jgi:ATP-dependent 26S proteasome regulatory subunit
MASFEIIAVATPSDTEASNDIYHNNAALKNVNYVELNKVAFSLVARSTFPPGNKFYMNKDHRLDAMCQVNVPYQVKPLNAMPEAKFIVYQIFVNRKKVFEGDAEIAFTPLVNTVINCNQIIFVNKYYIKIIKIIDNNENVLQYAEITSATEFVSHSTKEVTLNIKSIDFKSIGVGGLSAEFEILLRRVFLSRMVPEQLYKKLGIEHVKGVILFGPPGCGKTRIARSIAEIIGSKNVVIINGPEIFNKYVGESEANIRKIFENARANPNELCVIVMDEFESIVPIRGSGHESSDRVVNQLLSELDGVKKMNNVIVFGLTNRIDMIDPAIMRPGRFEVKICIGLPSPAGRKEIFLIHTEGVRKNNLLSDVDFDDLVARTNNFTGAEIEAVVKNCMGFVLRDQIDINNIKASISSLGSLGVFQISHNDFVRAIAEIKPMFGIAQDHLDQLAVRIRKLLPIDDILSKYKCSTKPLIVAICGEPKTGKTSMSCDIACHLASEAGLTYIRYCSARDFLAKSEMQRVNYLIQLFEGDQSTISSNGLIIIDNIEIILEFAPPNRFNNTLFQTIKTLLNQTKYHDLNALSFCESVDHVINIIPD